MAAKILIDLVPRFEASFGFVPVMPDRSKILIPGGEYANFYNGAEIYIETANDFEDITLAYGDTELEFGYKPLSKSGELGTLLAPPPIIGTHGSKNLTETMINDTDSFVVERYGDKPWEFKMAGLIVDMQDHAFPKDRINKLVKLFKEPSAIEVSGDWFDAHDIQSIYFTDVDINGVQGFSDTVSYVLTGKSIKPIEFFLNGEEI